MDLQDKPQVYFLENTGVFHRKYTICKIHKKSIEITPGFVYNVTIMVL